MKRRESLESSDQNQSPRGDYIRKMITRAGLFDRAKLTLADKILMRHAFESFEAWHRAYRIRGKHHVNGVLHARIASAFKMSASSSRSSSREALDPSHSARSSNSVSC